MRVMLAVFAATLLFASGNAVAQAPDSARKAKKETRRSVRPPREPAPLFREETPLTLTLTANWGRVRRDKQDDAPWRAATITFEEAGGSRKTIALRVRTRGNFRLKTCEMPPLRLDFSEKEREKTPFAQLDRPKLVSVCRNDDASDRRLLHEHQLYRVHKLLTPMSVRTRLARITYADSGSGKTIATRWAIIAEDIDELAQRTGLVVSNQKGAGPADLEPDELAVFGLFQYLIANTDFSIASLHNVEMVRDDTAYYAVAYDFDWSGVVNAPYARPDPKLHIQHVRQRLYRGYCTPRDAMDRAVQRFTSRKDAIYALYADSVGSLLDERERRQALEYFDEFYKTLANEGAFRVQVLRACLGGAQ